MKLFDKIKYLFSLEWLDFSETAKSSLHTSMWVEGYTDFEIEQEISKLNKKETE